MRKLFLQSLILLAMAGIAAALTYFFHPARPALYLAQEVPGEGEISLSEALALERNGGVLWIDARQQAAYQMEHIPGALPLNPQQFNAQILEVMKAVQDNLERSAVIYCDAKKCAASHEVAEQLRQVHPDPDKVRVLHGGWPVWKAGR